MATIGRTIYNRRLSEPYSITVECGGKKAEFKYEDRSKVGDWLMSVWKEQEDGFFNTHSPAFIFYNIDWDADHVLYARYELEGEIES